MGACRAFMRVSKTCPAFLLVYLEPMDFAIYLHVPQNRSGADLWPRRLVRKRCACARAPAVLHCALESDAQVHLNAGITLKLIIYLGQGAKYLYALCLGRLCSLHLTPLSPSSANPLQGKHVKILQYEICPFCCKVLRCTDLCLQMAASADGCKSERCISHENPFPCL
jgi:hypothetical protein